MEKGQIISGEFGKIAVRQKSDSEIQLGELLVAENGTGKVILQVFDLSYGSQISQVNLELAAGLKLEEESELNFMDGNLRNYKLAFLKPMIYVRGKDTTLCKGLPSFFSKVRSIVKDDLTFLETPKNALFVGNLRSGSSVLDFPVYLDGSKVFSHHILIPATTGRGKSNLMSCLLWDVSDKDYCGVLVLDPHDEYYGRTSLGLKDKGCVYYSPKNVPTGGRTLKINIHDLKPGHFNGVMEWSAPQSEAMDAYYRKFGRNWIDALLDGRNVDYVFNEGTIAVLRRRLSSLLSIEFKESKFFCSGVFDFIAGETTIGDIANDLERSKVVIVDTSNFSGPVEILIGSLISTEVFNRYRRYKLSGEIEYKPIISIVLEEAPRVLGKEVLEKGSNIFSTIAREGRKFKVGLCAITQLPSLIPRQILANMNTKIILGVEMAPEREAIIDSASQDLSTDSRNIASLDIGEAIITSNFSRFAMPVKIPKFSEFAKVKSEKDARSFAGVKL